MRKFLTFFLLIFLGYSIFVGHQTVDEKESIETMMNHLKAKNVSQEERLKLINDIRELIDNTKNLEAMVDIFKDLSDGDEYAKYIKAYFFGNLARQKFNLDNPAEFKRYYNIYTQLMKTVEPDLYDMSKKIEIKESKGILTWDEAKEALGEKISKPSKNDKGMWEIELPGNGIKFVFIPPGLYRIKNKREPTFVESFLIGKYEVTNSDYRKYCTEKNIKFEIKQDKYNHPVVNVTWEDAKQFCEWLAQKNGLEIDLPTGSQWEKAAASGKDTDYFWGDKINGYYLWYWGNSGGHTNEAGKNLPNHWGICDILGNAAEWAKDSPPGNSSQKIIRGGHWDSDKGKVMIIPKNIESQSREKKST